MKKVLELIICTRRWLKPTKNPYLNCRAIMDYEGGYSKVHDDRQDVVKAVDTSLMGVRILPALKDNYMYLIIDGQTNIAAVVDPVCPEVVLSAVEKENVFLSMILTTHHHWDHAGGNERLVKMYPKTLQVFGGDCHIPALTNEVEQDARFNIGSLKVRVLHTPCHTKGHLCYHVESSDGEHAVFTGDTLFQGGCGRFFEGTADQMYNNLYTILGTLPDNTKVYCGHEYTVQNLTYALHVEPTNDDIRERLEWAKRQRTNNRPTVPSLLSQERAWNPFMRVHLPGLQRHVQEAEPIATMRSLRTEKDNFKG